MDIKESFTMLPQSTGQGSQQDTSPTLHKVWGVSAGKLGEWEQKSSLDSWLTVRGRII